MAVSRCPLPASCKPVARRPSPVARKKPESRREKSLVLALPESVRLKTEGRLSTPRPNLA